MAERLEKRVRPGTFRLDPADQPPSSSLSCRRTTRKSAQRLLRLRTVALRKATWFSFCLDAVVCVFIRVFLPCESGAVQHEVWILQRRSQTQNAVLSVSEDVSMDRSDRAGRTRELGQAREIDEFALAGNGYQAE